MRCDLRQWQTEAELPSVYHATESNDPMSLRELKLGHILRVEATCRLAVRSTWVQLVQRHSKRCAL